MQKHTTKVMLFGTFDGVHDGHRNLFAQAAAYGDYVIVVVARDQNVKDIKGRLPQRDEFDRMSALLDEDVIDEIVLGEENVTEHTLITQHRPDVILLGYDQHDFVESLHSLIAEQELPTKVVRATAYKPEIFKSSKINAL